MKLFFLMFLALFTMTIEAQDFSKDSLVNKSDKELLTLFNEVRVDSIKAEKVIRFYLDRARKEKDTLKMAKAYDKLILISNKPLKILSFSDSIINLTKTIVNRDYPALGYIYKGDVYRKSNLKLATKNYTEAYQFSLKRKNMMQQVFVSDILITMWMYWGDKKKALGLQKKRHQLLFEDAYITEIKTFHSDRNASFKNLYTGDIISSIQNFIVCHSNLNQLDSALIFLKKGILKNKEYDGYWKQYHDNSFILYKVEIDFKSKNYEEVILKSNELLETIDADIRYNFEIVLNLHFFKGLSLIKLGKVQKGIKHLKKAELILEEKEFLLLLPYHRDLFVELLNYYTTKNNAKLKIKYLYKLQEVDSIFKKNYQFFEPNLIRNYETPQLLEKKEEVITGLKQKNKKTSVKVWWMFAFLTISLLTILYYFKRQQLYKKRFDNLILQQEISKLKDIEVVSELENVESTLITNNGVSFEIETDILNHLKHFETKNGYLSQGISLHNMSKTFGTNRIYLSKVIKLKRGKKFTTYINNLRIEYSFKELKVNLKLRKYTIKAIAKECGFSSAESFSKKFYKKYGIYPSYYIKNLEKTNF